MRHQFQFSFFLFLLFLCLFQEPSLISQEAHPATQNPIELPHNAPAPLPFPQIPEEHNPDLDLGPDHFMADFLKMLTTLGLLIGLLLFVSWYLKRMVNSRVIKQNDMSNIKVIEQRQLSPRSTIHIVEIEGKNLVIGESHGNICLLTELPPLYEPGKN